MRLEYANKEKGKIEKTAKGSRTETQEEQDPADQGQAQSDIDPLEPVVPSSSIVGEGSVSISGVELIPFIPTKGEEVPNFNTIFYDKEKKRIVKRTEKKVDTGGKPGVMVTDKMVVHDTHKHPRLVARDRVALNLSTEDNVDRIMTDLEQSQKKVTQLKETLKKEKSESQSLKRKYEDMIDEVEVSNVEC